MASRDYKVDILCSEHSHSLFSLLSHFFSFTFVSIKVLSMIRSTVHFNTLYKNINTLAVFE